MQIAERIKLSGEELEEVSGGVCAWTITEIAFLW